MDRVLRGRRLADLTDGQEVAYFEVGERIDDVLADVTARRWRGGTCRIPLRWVVRAPAAIRHEVSLCLGDAPR